MRISIILGTLIFLFFSLLGKGQHKEEYFKQLLNEDWEEVFSYTGDKNWKKFWRLDGRRASLKTSSQGMDFYAGNENANDTCHAVLWTKKAFQGDIMIKYLHTKLDTQIINVNILYIQATGEKPYTQNIHRWAKDRRVPSMKKYFNHMNTLHISYAAFGTKNQDKQLDYLRARRYMPALKQGLKNTAFGKSYENTSFFRPGITNEITVIKKGFDLFMHIKNEKDEMLCHWNYQDFPPIEAGYIGLRHMYTRASRYKDFKIYLLK